MAHKIQLAFMLIHKTEKILNFSILIKRKSGLIQIIPLLIVYYVD